MTNVNGKLCLNTTPPTKICIIEDDLPIQQMYRYRLEKEGYAVRSAADGATGLTVIKNFDPALILLDLRMPQMSGDEMLRRLRAEEWGSGIRVIILTNISKSEAPFELRLLSVDRYIVKAHTTPAQVTEIIKEVLAD